MSDKHYVHAPDETELAKVLKGSRSWFESHGTTLIYSVAAVLAVTAIIVYVQRTPPATAPASQALLAATRAGDSLGMQSSTPEDFRDIADQFPDSEIGTRARLRQADLLLNKASENMFRNRKVAMEDLEAAQKAYERLIDRKDLSADVRQRVLAGLARVTESRCDGSEASTKAAIDGWKKLLDEFPDSKIYQSIAEDRIKQLPQESTKSFYAWFQRQDPKPSDDLLMPQDGPANVPDIPNPFELPNFGLPSAGGTSATTPAADPATPGTPAAATTPGTDTPAAPTAETSDPSAPAKSESSPEPAAPDSANPEPAAPTASDAPASPAAVDDARPATEPSPAAAPPEPGKSE